MYWKNEQMFVCKLEEKDVPELAVPPEKVSEATPGPARPAESPFPGNASCWGFWRRFRNYL